VDLKCGAVHPRQLLVDLRGAAPTSGPWVFRSEVAWREFYADVLYHRPDTVWANFTPALDHLNVDEGPEADARFAAWCEGRTGYPFVDAGMRQLVAEGWMHNRVRMVTASFLVKDLHLDWRRGAAFFLEHLVDGDVASNQHGWQWTAGTGTDAAPYFRIFHPTTQGRNHDPDGTYIRRYVPELRHFAGDVHEPHAAPTGRGRARQPALGEPVLDYPEPIVDHAVERRGALDRLGNR
jgi:deoxyribodipyrimidine photo-lyase